MNAIEISGLSKTFKGKKGVRVVALEGLDLSIAQGEVFGFLGPNGAGKSTTIKSLLGLIRPTSGNAQIMGTDSSTPAARCHVGYLPENPAFYDYLTAEEYLTFVGRSFSMPEVQLREQRERVLKLLDLWEARKRPMRGYSKGMVQRVGLAQVLIHNPDVYILDEPMSGLDPVGRALVKEILIDLKKQGKTVFFSTHVTADVEVVCDRVGVIVGGRLCAVNTVEEIMETGIEGYSIQLIGAIDGEFSDFTSTKAGDTRSEFYVSRDRLDFFMGELNKSQAKVHLIEPKRTNLEAFFLDIVRQEDCGKNEVNSSNSSGVS
jgi:ABC-2 type transport system ATP-binding protein